MVSRPEGFVEVHEHIDVGETSLGMATRNVLTRLDLPDAMPH